MDDPAQLEFDSLSYGGSGGLPCRSQQIADAKLAGRSVSARWPIPSETRQTLIDTMATIAASSEDARASVGAGKVLVEMDKLNQADEHLALKPQQSAQTIHNTQINVSASFENLLSEGSAKLLEDLRAMVKGEEPCT